MTSGIVRRGDRLLRPMGPWSPAVHEYLRHLEAAGFAGSPPADSQVAKSRRDASPLPDAQDPAA